MDPQPAYFQPVQAVEEREFSSEWSPRDAEQTGDDEVRTPPTVQDAIVAARRAVAVAKAQGSSSLEAESYPVAEVLAHLDWRLAALEPGRGISTEEWFEELPVPEARVTLSRAAGIGSAAASSARAKEGVWSRFAQAAWAEQ